MGFNLTPAGNPGFWGPITASLDWCEENYIHSHYIAEWWNSLSNLFYIILSIVGIFNLLHVGSDTSTFLAYLGLMLVGIGSFLFHATLLFETQMMDELPMIWAMSFMVYNIVTTSPTVKNRSLYAAAISFYAIFVTVAYLYFPNPLVHEVGFAMLCVVNVFYPLHQIAFQFSKSHPKITGKLWFGTLFAHGTFLLGFFLWNMENMNCDPLRAWRNKVGYPIRVVGELHAWWHFFTAVGCYAGNLMNAYVRLITNGRPDVEIKWFGLPYLSSSWDKARIDEFSRSSFGKKD